jgi:beta-xylosidase
MNIDPPDSEYNFDRIDRIMDFIVKNDMHPYVELGFKDILLIKNPKVLIKQEKRQIIFQSRVEYGHFLKKFLYHYSTRYGIKEIENWYFEQWCDPRLINTKNAIEYFEWFDEAYRTIKEFSKNIKVGGAGLGRYMYNGQDHESFFRIWKSRKSHPDFISVYSYSYQPSRNRDDEFDSQQSQDTIYTYNLINSVKEALTKSGLSVSELHITEWNATISDRNCINDSCYQACFVVKNILENFGAIEFMGYWLGSDLLSEYLDSRPLLVGGSGLLTKDGIKKPAYHAFSFMQRLYSYILGSDENSIVTTDGRYSFMIVCHNYKCPSFKYYLKQEGQIQPDQIYQMFENDEIINIHIKIDNIMKGIYTVKNYSVSRKFGSVQDEWMQMGRPENMDQIDIAYLEQICIPRIYFEQIETDNDTLDFSITLLPHEIRQIHIQYKGPGK